MPSLFALLAASSCLVVVAATPFQLTIFDTTSPLNGDVLNAAGGFFLGLSQPATYCPTNQGIVCPAGNETLFAGLDALWVETPGGQQIYVEDDGAISYTIAHSSSLPPGAVVGGFYNITVASDCAPDFTIFNWASSNQGTAPVTSTYYFHLLELQEVWLMVI